LNPAAKDRTNIRRATAQYSPRVFDPAYYLHRYPDLKSAFGSDHVKAFDHYVTNGAKEGRSPNPFIDPLFYRAIHADLAGHDNIQVLDHWWNHGFNEGRMGSEDYHGRAYLQYHPDLSAAFGENADLAFAHWLGHGHRENRVCAIKGDCGVVLKLLEETSALNSQVFFDNSVCQAPVEPGIKEWPSNADIVISAFPVAKAVQAGRIVVGSLKAFAVAFGVKAVLKKAIKVAQTPSDNDRRDPACKDPLFTGDIFVDADIVRTA